MMKQILAAACAMTMMLTGAAMAETDVRVTALKGPTAMGMAALMNEAESGAVNGNDYAFTIASAVDEVSPKLVKGETDIAAVPANLAAVLYNNTKGQVEVLAVNTLGVLYIVESGESVSSVADLRGRTIYASGKGATPEYALNYILYENGGDPEKDVNIEWKSEHAECLAALLAEENAVAMLPQPFVTTAQMKSDKIKVRLDLNAEWDAVQAGSDAPSQLITGVVAARGESAGAALRRGRDRAGRAVQGAGRGDAGARHRRNEAALPGEDRADGHARGGRGGTHGRENRRPA